MTFLLILALLGAPETAEEKTAFIIGSKLRCPVCQGMPIAESPSSMAQAMMAQVRELVAEGKTTDEIEEHFVERYGEWVLLNPRRHGLSWGLWFLPPVLLVGLLLGFRNVMKKTGHTRPTAGASASSGENPHTAAVRAAVDEL